MTTTEHPLTETAAAEIWDALEDRVPWMKLYVSESFNILAALRAAFDAGREHEHAQADPTLPAEVTDKMVEAAADILAFKRTGTSLRLLESDCRDSWRDQARAALEVALAVATPAMSSEPSARDFFGVPDTHGAPHHNVKAIRAGDFVVQVDKDGSIRAGIAYHQDTFGEWRSNDSRYLIWVNDASADRPDAVTVWPAPTPPAVEVEMPGKHPAHITDVGSTRGDVYSYMALDRHGDWCGVNSHGEFGALAPRHLAAFTLPDGTRARRNGEHADGAPRFIKVREGEEEK